MHWILLACLLLVAAPARATDLYYCDCQSPGAQSGCTTGSDTNPGTIAQPRRSWEQLVADADSVLSACGDTFNVCEGGRWQANGILRIDNELDCRSNRKRIRSYDPDGTFTQRPLVNKSTAQAAIEFGRGSGGAGCGATGYAIEGIDIVYNGTNPPAGQQDGIQFACPTTDVVADDMLVQGFGVNLQNQNPGGGTANAPRVTVTNSRIRLGWVHGQLGEIGSGSIYSGNDYDGNVANGCASGCGFNHAVYFGSHTAAVGWEFSNNYIHNSCRNPGGACVCNVLAIRGGTNAIVRGNRVEEIDTGGSRSGDACSVRIAQNSSNDDDGLRDSIVDGNQWIGVDFFGFCGAQRVIYENNVTVIPAQASLTSAGKSGIDMAGRQQGCGSTQPGDLTSDANIVRNNSVYINAGVESVCYNLRTNEGSNYVAYGNSCFLDAGATSTSRCMEIASASLWQADYNVCHRIGGSTAYGRIASSNRTLAQWRTDFGGCAASGNDCSAVEANPLYSNPAGYDLSLQSGSPAIDIAVAGESALFAAEDFDGRARPQGSGFDAGAFEFPSDDPPPPPPPTPPRARPPMLLGDAR